MISLSPWSKGPLFFILQGYVPQDEVAKYECAPAAAQALRYQNGPVGCSFVEDKKEDRPMSKNARKKAKLREKKKERGAKDDASSDLKGMPEMIGLLGVDLFYMRESLLSCRFAIGYPHIWILFLVQFIFV